MNQKCSHKEIKMYWAAIKCRSFHNLVFFMTSVFKVQKLRNREDKYPAAAAAGKSL